MAGNSFYKCHEKVCVVYLTLCQRWQRTYTAIPLYTREDDKGYYSECMGMTRSSVFHIITFEPRWQKHYKMGEPASNIRCIAWVSSPWFTAQIVLVFTTVEFKELFCRVSEKIPLNDNIINRLGCHLCVSPLGRINRVWFRITHKVTTDWLQQTKTRHHCHQKISVEELTKKTTAL